MLTPEQKPIVRMARELIVERSRWTRGAYARDARDCPCAINEPTAAKFDGVGALACGFVQLVGDTEVAVKQALALGRLLSDTNLEIFNDQKGHAAVLAIFDKALAA